MKAQFSNAVIRIEGNFQIPCGMPILPNRLNQERETSKKFVVNVSSCKSWSAPVFAEYCAAMQAGTALRHRGLRPSNFDIFPVFSWEKQPYKIVYIVSIIRNARGRSPELASVHGALLSREFSPHSHYWFEHCCENKDCRNNWILRWNFQQWNSSV